jgi:hypothetical protein
MTDQATSQAQTAEPRPGRKQGATGELTTIWHVKKGHEQQLRAALETLDKWPIEEKAHAGNLIGTLHDRRWVLFDDDTRMLFTTNYDGEWVPYIEAFAEHNAAAFNMIFTHIEGWPEKGLNDPGVFDYIIAHQLTAIEYMRFYDGTVQEIQAALALQKAFEELLDSSTFQEAVRDPAFASLLGTPEFKAVLDHAAG